MPYIVGDSFGGVQAAQTAEDSQRRQMFANSMANLLGSLRERNEMNYRNRALQLEEQHREKALQLQKDEMNWRSMIQMEHNDILRQGTEQYGEYMKHMMEQPSQQTINDQKYQDELAARQA